MADIATDTIDNVAEESLYPQSGPAWRDTIPGS